MQSYNMQVTIHFKDGGQWKMDYNVEPSRDSESAFHKIYRKVLKQVGASFKKITLDSYQIIGYY
jgi:hypothetical protein